jgi:hypothetical protein
MNTENYMWTPQQCQEYDCILQEYSLEVVFTLIVEVSIAAKRIDIIKPLCMCLKVIAR